MFVVGGVNSIIGGVKIGKNRGLKKIFGVCW